MFSCFASHGYEWHLHAYYYFLCYWNFNRGVFFLAFIYFVLPIDDSFLEIITYIDPFQFNMKKHNNNMYEVLNTEKSRA